MMEDVVGGFICTRPLPPSFNDTAVVPIYCEVLPSLGDVA